MLTRTPRCFVALLLAARAVPCPAAELEVSVERAQAMLVREDLGTGIYLFRAPSDLDYWTATNTVVIVNGDDVVVFDSCTRAVTARAVIEEIRKLTPKPVRFLINSHWHQDHWSGNQEYMKAFPGLRIIATAETRAYMSLMGPAFFVEEAEFFGTRGQREEYATALRTGRLRDGSPFTPEIRARREASLAMADQFEREIEALPRVLPNVVYRGEMAFWSGAREFRLLSLTGDATGSTVLYLPVEKLLVTGDVLVSPEDGKGPPPWSTNSYALTPWVESLHRLDTLDVKTIVPGQGPPMHDKAYLERTIDLFASIIGQVRTALASGKVKLSDVQAAVNVDSIGRAYTPKVPLPEDFPVWVKFVAKKAMQEALDGAVEDK
jgi:cyclase